MALRYYISYFEDKIIIIDAIKSKKTITSIIEDIFPDYMAHNNNVEKTIIIIWIKGSEIMNDFCQKWFYDYLDYYLNYFRIKRR